MKTIHNIIFLIVCLFLGEHAFAAETTYDASKPISATNPVPSWSVGAPLLQENLIGNASNYYPNKVRGFSFGRAPIVGNVLVDLWEGPTTTYVFTATPQQMRVVSTSAADTLAGTGTQKVEIHYLDNLYVARTETVSLNGVTPVLTVATNILRINYYHSSQSGTGGISAGNISLTNTAGTVTYGFIALGNNTAHQAIYTIPAGKTGYLSHWQTSSGSSTSHFCQTSIKATAHDGVLNSGVFVTQDQMGSQNNGAVINFPTPIPIPGMADVKMMGICDASNANAIIIGAMMGWIE